MTNRGQRFNAGKPGTHLLPSAALMEIAKVLEYGAWKYSAHNYRKGLPWSTYVGSCLRHMFAWARGEELDKESGYHHLAHAGCNVVMALDAVIYGHGTDDRWASRRKLSALWKKLEKIPKPPRVKEKIAKGRRARRTR